MSDTTISNSNTPIFDQMLAEYAARGKRYESLIAGGAVSLRPAGLQGVRAPYGIIDEFQVQGVGQTDDVVNAAAKPSPFNRLVEKEPVVKTLQQKQYEETTQEAVQNLFSHVNDQLVDFYRQHPLAVIDDVKFESQPDGGAIMFIEGKEPINQEKIDSVTYDDLREAAATMSPFHGFSKNYLESNDPEPTTGRP